MSLYLYIKERFRDHRRPRLGIREILAYIGPGLLVTIGFIDPGNWAANIAAGSDFGYTLLWMITLGTTMLIILQHNVAHLGIASGLCLSEAATIHLKPYISRSILSTGLLATISTALAEILGGAIALQMLFSIPIKAGAVIVTLTALVMIFNNSYRKIERWIIGFVSLIGLSFIYELSLVQVNWDAAITGWIKPSFPDRSMVILMSVLGAVVMPHNLFLHSEVIQSRQHNLEDDKAIRKRMDYEFVDTFLSMVMGFAINSAMVLVAASTFYQNGLHITELQQAKQMLVPLLGPSAGVVFALALLFAGISSSITAGMSAGTISAGFFGEPYDTGDNHTRIGIAGTMITAMLLIFLISNPLQGLIYSQMLLSIQLPVTIFLQIYLTSSKKVMGKYVNKKYLTGILLLIGTVVTILNIMLLVQLFRYR